MAHDQDCGSEDRDSENELSPCEARRRSEAVVELIHTEATVSRGRAELRHAVDQALAHQASQGSEARPGEALLDLGEDGSEVEGLRKCEILAP